MGCSQQSTVSNSSGRNTTENIPFKVVANPVCCQSGLKPFTMATTTVNNYGTHSTIQSCPLTTHKFTVTHYTQVHGHSLHTSSQSLTTHKFTVTHYTQVHGHSLHTSSRSLTTHKFTVTHYTQVHGHSLHTSSRSLTTHKFTVTHYT